MNIILGISGGVLYALYKLLKSLFDNGYWGKAVVSGNIMRRKDDGHIFLIDFGLSKHYSDDGQPDTSTTIGLGTEGYAPLEQVKRATVQNSFRPTIDVYALGTSLFKMLTGETPPSASDILDDEEILSDALNKYHISRHLQNVITEAMQLLNHEIKNNEDTIWES